MYWILKILGLKVIEVPCHYCYSQGWVLLHGFGFLPSLERCPKCKGKKFVYKIVKRGKEV